MFSSLSQTLSEKEFCAKKHRGKISLTPIRPHSKIFAKNYANALLFKVLEVIMALEVHHSHSQADLPEQEELSLSQGGDFCGRGVEKIDDADGMRRFSSGEITGLVLMIVAAVALIVASVTLSLCPVFPASVLGLYITSIVFSTIGSVMLLAGGITFAVSKD